MKIKRIFLLAIMVLTVLIASGCSLMVPGEDPVSMDSIAELVETISQFVSGVIALGGAAAIVTVLIQLGKLTGVVKDGTAKTWSTVLNAVFMAGLVALKIVNPDLLPADVDQYIRTILNAAVLILGFLGVSLPTSAALYDRNRGAPLVGYSISDDSPGD